MPEVVSRVLHSLAPALQRAGSSLDALLSDHGLASMRIGSCPTARIPWDTFSAILEDAGKRLGGPEALEQVGGDDLLPSWPVLGHLVARHVNPVAVFQLAVRWFGPAIFKGIRGVVEEIPGGLVETVTIPADRRDSREFFWLIKGVMSQAPKLVGWDVSQIDLDQSERRGTYRLQFVRTSDRGRDARSSRNPLDLDRDLEELMIFSSDLAVGGSGTSAAMGTTVADRTRSVLLADAPTEWVTAADVAKRLAMSERTLARHLQAEGASFRKIRDDVRQELALEWIQIGEPISKVAYELGFSDVAAFHRAFRRWTGESPSRFKRGPA